MPECDVSARPPSPPALPPPVPLLFRPPTNNESNGCGRSTKAAWPQRERQNFKEDVPPLLPSHLHFKYEERARPVDLKPLVTIFLGQSKKELTAFNKCLRLVCSCLRAKWAAHLRESRIRPLRRNATFSPDINSLSQRSAITFPKKRKITFPSVLRIRNR